MKRKDNMPELVYWGLWGIKSKGVALGFMWFSIVLAAGCFVVGYLRPKAFLGVLLLIAAAWYWYSIRWVDKNSTWTDK
jgi:hypothetical protein